MYKNKQIYFGIIILILWHIFMLFCYNSPKVSDMYYQYYIKGGIEKWNRGIGSRYSYGDRIDFRKGGNSSDYILCGFSDQEKMGTWTCSENVYLFLLLNSTTKRDVNLYMSAFPFVSDKHQNLIIEVSVNGVAVKKLKYLISNSSQSLQIIKINNNIISSNKGNIVVEVKAKDLVSPSELGLSNDTRKLGLCVDSIMLKEIEK